MLYLIKVDPYLIQIAYFYADLGIQYNCHKCH